MLVVVLVGVIKLRTGKEADYETAEIKRKDLSLTVSASGEIKSDEEVSLKFQTSGSLAWVGVKKWDKVKKWQAIASLDKEELEKKLKKELSDYMTERWDYEEAMRDTYKNQPLTDIIKKTQERTGFDLDEAVLDVEIADIALKYATLVSPIEGIVTDIDVPYAGVNITPATAEFTISNPAKLIFSANIDETDVGRIKEGQKARIVLDAYTDETIESQVSQLAFTSTATSGGGTASEAKLPIPGENTAEKFKIGMNGDVEVIIEEKKMVLAAPLEAIQEKNGKKIVQVLEGKEAIEVVVGTGLETETEVEIISGLEEGQKVITAKTIKKK